jgi:hypothetical protein
MALDTSGSWVEGDDLRIIECLMLPFGTYVIDCTQNCCNQLQAMSDAAVLRVRALLDEYDAADQAESEQNLSDTEGKVLTRADILEWTVVNGGVSGATQEKSNVRAEIARYFAFCSCLGSVLPGNGGYAGHSALIRS